MLLLLLDLLSIYAIFYMLVGVAKGIGVNKATKYVNFENIYTNNQLENIVKKLPNNYRPKKIIIYESRLDLFKHLLKSQTVFLNLFDVRVWIGIVGGRYEPAIDEISIFLFTFNNKNLDDVDRILYFTYSFAHELRHRWQKYNHRIYRAGREKDANNFAHYFLNKNSALISKVMNLEDEWYYDEPLVQ